MKGKTPLDMDVNFLAIILNVLFISLLNLNEFKTVLETASQRLCKTKIFTTSQKPNNKIDPQLFFNPTKSIDSLNKSAIKFNRLSFIKPFDCIKLEAFIKCCLYPLQYITAETNSDRRCCIILFQIR